jgi:hypothetical protein
MVRSWSAVVNVRNTGLRVTVTDSDGSNRPVSPEGVPVALSVALSVGLSLGVGSVDDDSLDDSWSDGDVPPPLQAARARVANERATATSGAVPVRPRRNVVLTVSTPVTSRLARQL